jgi:hypothetical protein
MGVMTDETDKVERVRQETEKKDHRDKFTVVLPPEVREAFEELTAAGFVVSRVVVEMLEDAVPVFKELARAARAAKMGKQLTLEEYMGRMLQGLGEQLVTKERRGRPRKVKL